MAAELPTVKPDVLIIVIILSIKKKLKYILKKVFIFIIICYKESTYGVNLHEPREEREKRFTDTVKNIVTRGGKCLIPVFALGRAQELLLILGRYLVLFL
jgi:cleavage and polyadenylation specificity factor subunit 3